MMFSDVAVIEKEKGDMSPFGEAFDYAREDDSTPMGASRSSSCATARGWGDGCSGILLVYPLTNFSHIVLDPSVEGVVVLFVERTLFELAQDIVVELV